MSQERQYNIKTKQSLREKIWIHMVKEDLTMSSRNLCNRIPYFKGAMEATQRLSELDAFKKAKLLMISPGKSQESTIVLSLQKGKEILIPRPRLMDGLFLLVKNADVTSEETQNVVIRRSMKQIESPIGFDKLNLKVDMLVLGSVCVNKTGCRIGDGEGFADLEYAILSKMKAVNEHTIIITTVHDCQILDNVPDDIFNQYDVPVDIIITPTQTIVVNPKFKKPTEIIWSAISKRRLAAIPILNEIKQLEEMERKTLDVKEINLDLETHKQEKLHIKKIINKIQPRLSHRKLISDSIIKENQNDKDIRKKSFLRKRKLQKSKDNDNDDFGNKTVKKQSGSKSKVRHRSGGDRNQSNFSLRLSNIASTVRVRDLKCALQERGVKPNNIAWYGQRGFCYLQFGKLRKNTSIDDQSVQVDSIIASLQQLKVSENAFILVEPAKPVTRIEVTNTLVTDFDLIMTFK
ncbi:PREDICTED: 5-formyltetrahydrofolate cyclo-ligase-like protein COG0212 [Ceratosolen solmsi marchali]|uniref:5-formyltetrahydrofolate cyclo-ligase-like protein COG0212 n=1 Tax=Ceratosolen solmsi marchali TaxID=326594 RepID=A0AAJ7DUM8_9HYME|nr:PREDICTED: 5-formyltetrahydrofolate cyclo-ligase-like protein COG0212 [Ceratosolen solmsi marchali]